MNDKIIVFLISYLLSRLIFKMANFNYSLSEGLFNIDFVIDIGTWILMYILVNFVVSIIRNKLKRI